MSYCAWAIAVPTANRRTADFMRNILYSTNSSSSEPEFQAELHPPHRRLYGPDLAVTCAIRCNLVRTREAHTVWIPEPGRVGEIERFPAELDVVVLLHVKILEE